MPIYSYCIIPSIIRTTVYHFLYPHNSFQTTLPTLFRNYFRTFPIYYSSPFITLSLISERIYLPFFQSIAYPKTMALEASTSPAFPLLLRKCRGVCQILPNTSHFLLQCRAGRFFQNLINWLFFFVLVYVCVRYSRYFFFIFGVSMTRSLYYILKVYPISFLEK